MSMDISCSHALIDPIKNLLSPREWSYKKKIDASFVGNQVINNKHVITNPKYMGLHDHIPDDQEAIQDLGIGETILEV